MGRFVMGRVVCEASCPWGKFSWGELSTGRVVNGTSCPWGELSLGQVVHGASCPWGELSVGRVVVGRVVHGASFDGASCPGTVNFQRIAGPETPEIYFNKEIQMRTKKKDTCNIEYFATKTKRQIFRSKWYIFPRIVTLY